MKQYKFNYAVYNIETGFRLTGYQRRTNAIWARNMILRDQPEMRGKVEVKQKSFESGFAKKKSK